jgi:hypothetical protein
VISHRFSPGGGRDHHWYGFAVTGIGFEPTPENERRLILLLNARKPYDNQQRYGKIKG